MQKKNEKKRVNPAIQNGGNEKKNLKKNVQSRQPVTVGHVSGIGSFPPFETAGMGKKTKKKIKNESGSFWNFFFQRGSDLKIFLGIGPEKKNSHSFLILSFLSLSFLKLSFANQTYP